MSPLGSPSPEIKVPDAPLDEMVSEAIALEDNAPLRVMEFLGFDRCSGVHGDVARGPADVGPHHSRRLFHVARTDRHHELSVFPVAA